MGDTEVAETTAGSVKGRWPACAVEVTDLGVSSQEFSLLTAKLPSSAQAFGGNRASSQVPMQSLSLS